MKWGNRNGAYTLVIAVRLFEWREYRRVKEKDAHWRKNNICIALMRDKRVNIFSSTCQRARLWALILVRAPRRLRQHQRQQSSPNHDVTSWTPWSSISVYIMKPFSQFMLLMLLRIHRSNQNLWTSCHCLGLLHFHLQCSIFQQLIIMRR